MSLFSLTLFLLIAAIGFMMGYLYKKTSTNAQFFNINPDKILRIFWIVFALAMVSTFVLSWLTMHVLSDTKIPDESSLKFQDTKSVMIFFLNLFFFALIILSNLHSQTLKKISVLPYIVSLAFYVGFVLNDAYYISDYFILWKKSLKLLKGDFEAFHLINWMKSLFALIVTAFNAGMIWWGLRK
jgi:hypothetical protein